MEINESDNTIKDILDEDRTQTRKRKRGKGCVLRMLSIAVLLFIGFYGFILFRQKMLDLEAEALLRARQTLTSQAGSPGSSEMENPEVISEGSPAVQPTEDPMLERTATVEAQLTSVAEFQQTVTPDQ
jgi:hypothetical protein